jgi:hypothetical protein
MDDGAQCACQQLSDEGYRKTMFDSNDYMDLVKHEIFPPVFNHLDPLYFCNIRGRKNPIENDRYFLFLLLLRNLSF